MKNIIHSKRRFSWYFIKQETYGWYWSLLISEKSFETRKIGIAHVLIHSLIVIKLIFSTRTYTERINRWDEEHNYGCQVMHLTMRITVTMNSIIAPSPVLIVKNCTYIYWWICFVLNTSFSSQLNRQCMQSFRTKKYALAYDSFNTGVLKLKNVATSV